MCQRKKRGFTLIELSVVVLIIGILAAVALPQYNKAVEKSKSAEGLALLKSVGQAAQAYYLENGTHLTSFDQLSVDMPSRSESITATHWGQPIGENQIDVNQLQGFVGGGSMLAKAVSADWGEAIHYSGKEMPLVFVFRLNGKYAYTGNLKGGFGLRLREYRMGGFAGMELKIIPQGAMGCFTGAKANSDDYCTTLFHLSNITPSGYDSWYPL